ncbi:hypothetical protein [Nostoc sp. ChiQUE01b]|uniref:hypothetical protein n=1 Tax=Nostoc sp. ChiQUE01b TaxID=3075376 RepID=UPI002AD22FB5|nr:hypothetical protein [Nostoc sp. ChiQUE01b]MDZ8261423.1 hypothetical protein [Nostoc sp. ChiQUE01b]
MATSTNSAIAYRSFAYATISINMPLCVYALPNKLKRSLGSREQSSGSRERSSGSREQSSGSREQSSGSREQSSGSRERSSGSRERSSGSRERSSGSREQSSGSRERSPLKLLSKQNSGVMKYRKITGITSKVD